MSVEPPTGSIPALLDRHHKRRELYPISEGNLRMIEAARSVGASAKFLTGSGGAIVGTYRDDAMFEALVAKLEPMGIKVFSPDISTPLRVI